MMEKLFSKSIIAISILMILGIFGILFYVLNSQSKQDIGPNPVIKIPNAKAEISFETLLKGAWSDGAEKKNYVIKTEADWIPILNKTGAELPQQIDFSKDMFIAVFQGEKDTGGYSIEITKIIENENNIDVFVKETEPGPKCYVTQALTRPYHIVKLKKSDKEVSFKTETVVTQCEQ